MAQDRRLKTRVNMASTVDTELANWIKELSSTTEVPISRLLDRAIRLLKEQYENNESSQE